MKNFVITIGREFGSGGHNLGQSLAKELGIPCYDRHLIKEAAVCGGFKMEELEEADEMKANRFLFKVPAKCNPFTGYGKPMNDTLFVVQSWDAALTRSWRRRKGLFLYLYMPRWRRA